MTKKNGKSENVTIVPARASVVPDYIMEVAPEERGLEHIAQYVRPPFIRVVQRQSSTELLDQFGEGDVIVRPGNMRVCEMKVDAKHRPTGESDGFLITPVFFYPEYMSWNPIELKGNAPAIRERSLDPNGAIAHKAANPDTRVEPFVGEDGKPSKYNIRHVEHLNFVVVIHGIDLDTPCILSFSRAEHTAGRNFCNVIKMRGGAIYGGIYAVHQMPRSNNQGEWWGLEVSNPGSDVSAPWVDREAFEKFKSLHQEYKKLHADAKLRVELDDADGEASANGETEY